LVEKNERIKKICDIFKNILKKEDYVVFAYLYGSIARGESHKYSDVDLAVFLKEPLKNYRKLLYLITLIKLRGVEIDVRVLNNAPPLFRYNVIKEGIILVDKDTKLREEFVYRTLVEALDIKESIEYYRKRRLEASIDDR